MTAYNKIGWSLPASRPSSLRSGGTFIAALAVLGLALTAAAAHAQSVWQGASTDYNAATNWAPNTVPAAAGQSATFANTGIGSIAVKSAQAPDSWTFAPSAHGYAIGGVATVTFGGAGIIDNATGQTISISKRDRRHGRCVAEQSRRHAEPFRGQFLYRRHHTRCGHPPRQSRQSRQ